jgi:lipopolysaccharide export system permease protein
VRLLSRYVLVRLAAPFAFALAALTGFMLLNQVARRFEQLAGKGLEWTVIAEVFALCLPFILALTLPMAVLVAVLFSFSNLAADNEITAMRASGVSVPQLLLPVLAWSVIMGLFTFGFVDQILPRSNARLRTLFFDIARKSPTFELHEQVINAIPSSQYFLRAGNIDQTRGRLRDVAIYDMSGQWSRRIIYADSGTMAVMGSPARDLRLTLFTGSVHEFPAAENADFRLTSFRQNVVVLRNVYDQLERNTADVIRGDREQSTCEMLTVVRSAGRDRRQAELDRRALLERDVRMLAELPSAAPVPAVGESSPVGYCTWGARLRELLLPRTAEAQRATQSGAPLLPPSIGSQHRVSGWGEVAGAAARGREADRRAAKYLVEVHKKFSIAGACIPFVLIAIVLALRFPRGGMGLVIGGAMAVFAVFWVGLTAGEALADKGYVSPWLAMWSPNIVLASAGVLGLIVVNRESGSTRGGDWNEIAQWLGDLRRRGARRP